MKICFVIGQLGIGGGERQLFLLLKGLDKTKFKPCVISFNPDKNDYWEEPIRELGVPVLFINRSPNKIKRLVELYKILSRERPSVVISWTLPLNFFVGIIASIIHIPLSIGSIRNDLYNPMKKERPLQRFLGTKGCNLFVTNSTRGKLDLINRMGVSPEKVRVIFNAVTLHHLNESGIESRDAIREKLQLPLHSFLLVSVGRIESSKNPEMLVRVLKRLSEKYDNVGAVFIGEGPETDKLKNMAMSWGINDKVFFTGKIPLAIRYLKAFDILCHTGLADGMPNVLLEGAVCGLPIVATRVNGSEDIIEHAFSGYLVDYNNDERFSEYVEVIYKNADLAIKMGEAARERVMSEDFQEEGMVQKFEKVFTSLV